MQICKNNKCLGCNLTMPFCFLEWLFCSSPYLQVLIYFMYLTMIHTVKRLVIGVMMKTTTDYECISLKNVTYLLGTWLLMNNITFQWCHNTVCPLFLARTQLGKGSSSGEVHPLFFVEIFQKKTTTDMNEKIDQKNPL